MQRPAGVTVISILFFAAAIYLWTIGVVKLVAPDAITLMSGAQFMYGLELAGPYMALLVGSGWAVVGWGLFCLHNWARWAAMLVMVIGVARLVPKILDGRIGRAFIVVRIADCPARRGCVVSRASARGDRQFRSEILTKSRPRIYTGHHG